jgi:hypothetical protein
MEWNRYFDMLIDWKKLPAYKAEPRVDSLIGFYLIPILTDILNVEIEGIIPEFPLRLGTINPKHEGTTYADRSFKVDFFAIGKNGKNYFIEFKTDSSSLREKQDIYLGKSKELGTEAIIKGILAIANVSTYPDKYKHLKQKLWSFGLIDDESNYSGKNPFCEVIYVIPAKNDQLGIVIDFYDIVNWFELKKEIDSFEKAFISALKLWHSESALKKK